MRVLRRRYSPDGKRGFHMRHNHRGQSLSATRRLVLTAVFAALAFATMFVFRFQVSFLTFDVKDAVITIAGLLFGPLTALSLSLLVAVLELVTLGDTGIYGFIMNFASTAAFSVVASLVYTYRKRLSGAMVGLGSAVVTMTALMMVLNYVITPLYTGLSATEVAGMLPTLLLPFNLVKALVNAALVLILYKPISRAMQVTRLMQKSADTEASLPMSKTEGGHHTRRVSLIVTLVGLALLALAVIVFYFVLGGELQLFAGRHA